MTAIPSGTKFIGVPSTTDTTERKSTQNNALSEVYTIEDIVGTTTVVNISSAQILSMGDTPIELLPQLGAGKYYDVMKIVWEYNYGTASYSGLGTDNIQITQDGVVFSVDNEILTVGSATVSILEGSKLLQATNAPVLLTVQGSSNPILGDGTLRLIITYTERTFGA